MLIPTRRDVGGMAAGLLMAGRAAAASLPVGPAAGSGPVTLEVPGTFRSIEQALASIATSGAADGTQYEIRVADGYYQLADTIRLDLAAGANVRLIGNSVDPARCMLEWTVPRVDGLVVADRHLFGLIDGFTLRKATKSEWPDNATGVLALRGAGIRLGPNIVIENWYYGAAAREASTLVCKGITVRHAGDVGIWAYRGSMVVADGAISADARDPLNGWGYGFQAEFQSSLFARAARSTGCLEAGFAALSASQALLPACIAEGNDGSGFLVRDGSRMEAYDAISRANGGYGLDIDGTGVIRGLTLNQANRLGELHRR